MKEWQGYGILSLATVAFGVVMFSLFSLPWLLSPSTGDSTPSLSKWGNAVAVKVCNNRIVIVRLPDGSMWLRSPSFRTYQVEDLKTIC
jgi:hypothetical protein